MVYDDRGGVRYRGRRLLSAYNAGYAAAMAQAHRDLTRLNKELQAQLEQVRAEQRELRILVQQRQRADVERAARLCELQQGLGAERDPTKPLQ